MTDRILIVEDDERIRSSMRLSFEGEGYDVDEAESGEQALDLFRMGPIYCRHNGARRLSHYTVIV